ncbi:MAG: peptide-N-glycosidase F-related protein, partial [Bacteroidota bacterium]
GSIYAKLSCKSNGDAYDRTGSVFLIPANKNVSALTAYQYGLDKLPVYIDNDSNSFQGIIQEKGYTPPIEIMRFYTSFGVDYFNEKREINNYDWANNVSYKEEISKLVPTNEREIWVGVFIGNYDKGGHTVSLDLEFYPSENSKDTIHIGNYISPLFSTVNTLEMSGQNYGNLFGNDTLKMSFELPENIENLQLLYTSTGHGGWEGGDEFNPKLNQIFIDGNEMFKIVPWRTDCATYRMSNPASGNFSDGLSSSDLSRSNWCPATLTPPYIIPLSELTPGQHTIEVVIDQGKNEGTNSSHWNVTGILVGKELKSNN